MGVEAVPAEVRRPSRGRDALLLTAAVLAGACATIAFFPTLAAIVGLAALAAVWRFPRGAAVVLALSSPLYDVLVFRVAGVADVRTLEILWGVVVLSLLWRWALGRPLPLVRPPRWFEVLLVALVGWYAIAALAAGGVRPLVEAAQTGYLAVVAWVLAALGGALAPEEVGRHLRVWGGLYVALLLVSFLLYAQQGPYTPRTVIGVPDGSVTFVTRDILIQEAGEDASAIARFGMLDNGPVGTAALNAAILPAALAFALTPFLRRRDRLVALSIAVGCAAAVVVTYSRAGWVVAVVAATAVLLLSGGRRAAIGVGVLAVALAVVVSLPSVAPRVQELTNTNESSYKSHQRMWTTALQMTEERPVFGWGPGNFAEVAQHLSIGSWLAIDISGDQAHNFVLELAAETGIPGALIGVALVCAVLLIGAFTLRGSPLAHKGFLVAAAAYAAMNLTLNAFRTEMMWAWFGAVVALIAHARRERRAAPAASV